MGQGSGGIIELVAQNISEVSYRICAEMISKMTGLTTSGVGVWNIVQKLGEEIKQYEKEKVEAHQRDKLQAGTKETPTIYQEADGIMIYTQGKDRREQIEKYKKEHPNEEVSKKVRNIELKLGMTYEGVKQKLKTYSKKTGLKYRNMGCQESNNYCRLTRRMKEKRMSWSKKGSENIAKVITTYASESCTDIIRHLNVQILPESFTEYAKRYIAEIEENIKEMKRKKVKTKEIYTFKQGSLEGYPQLKKILGNKEISELIYR